MNQRVILLLGLLTSSFALTVDEDYDVSSRNRYSYKYNVDDPEKETIFQASESGDPSIVRGSYKIALPDGRIQMVTYEVHPKTGYNAKVSYTGTAQYPDNPSYVASPYRPPARVRTEERKHKRQSKPVDERNRIASKRVPRNRSGGLNYDFSSDLITSASDQHYKRQTAKFGKKVKSSEIKKKIRFVEDKGTTKTKHATHKQNKSPAKPSYFEIIAHEAYTPNVELSITEITENSKENGENNDQTEEVLINERDINKKISKQPDNILNIYEAVPVTITAAPKVIQIKYTTELIDKENASFKDIYESVDQNNNNHVFPETGKIQDHIIDKNQIVPNSYKSQIKYIRQEDNDNGDYRQKEISLQQNIHLSKTINLDEKEKSKFITKRLLTTKTRTDIVPEVRKGTPIKSLTSSLRTTPLLQAQYPEIILQKDEDDKVSLDETLEQVFDDIFIEHSKSTTAKPAKLKTFRRVRIPKKLQSSKSESISIPEKQIFQPVHRNENVKLVFKNKRFVPEYAPGY